MALPYTFIAGTVIDPAQVNSNFTYLETLAGGALLRDGSNIMLAPIPLAAGTLALPGLTFTGDTNTGLYRSAADTFVFVAGGVAQATISAAGLTVNTTLTVTTLALTSLTISTPLGVASGGTGAATLTGLLKGNGTGAITGSATINDSNWSGTALALGNGGSGQTTAAAAATAFGLGVGNSPTFVALTLTNGQLVFPAVAVLSAGVTTLDEYRESPSGTVTAAFAIPGSSSFSYATATWQATKVGNRVDILVTMNFTPTIGTGSGTLTLTMVSFPYTAGATVIGWTGAMSANWTWPTSVTQVYGQISSGSTGAMVIGGQRTGGAVSAFAAANMATGQPHQITIGYTMFV